MPLVVFCVAAACTAAALVDPLMETLSNSGLFGPGPLTDHSTIDVIPALGVGAALSLTFIIALVRRTLARAVDRVALPPLLPVIYALQLSALCAMETVEQIVITGHPLGGTIWLGGPMLISLSVHAAGCVVVTLALSRLLRWSARTLVRVVALVYLLVFGRPRAPLAALASAFRAAIRRPIQDALERLAGCAPPALSI
ncbi:hypothetical protein EPN52_04120 [bacterium]|nr:MAG: hypothetical protein EPN52_04120 [bacterium]